LLKWYTEWKSQSVEKRHAAVLEVWESELARKPYDYEYRFEEHTKRFLNLLRRGSVMLPAVQAAQNQSPDLARRGTLEFFKAFWTGHCNPDLVKELLQDGRQTQVIACDIIAAAADTSWKDELAKLLRAPRLPTDPDPPSWSKLLDKACETLVICHEAEALPLLAELKDV
jgi:hypothetical protein